MKNNVPKLFYLLFIIICFIILTTCKKFEKVMLVSTGEVTNISTTSAEASGMVIDLGEGATQNGHCYAKTPNVTISGAKTQLTPAGTGGFTSLLANLEPGTKYYIKAYLSNGTLTVYGEEKSFTTVSASVPTLTTSAITSVTSTTAGSGGNITSDGGAPVTVRGVCWNTATSPTTANSKTTDGTGAGSFGSSLTGLTANTTYYVRAYATNSAGTAFGNEISFTTSAVTPVVPTLSTTVITAITINTASSGGNITSDGGGSITSRGVCWNTAINPTIANSKTSDGLGTGSFVSDLTGLSASTTYYVRAYATNSAGTVYGNELTFTTSAVTSTPPTAAIAAATLVANATATLNGAVNANGSSTSVTFEYGPTILYGSTATASPSPVTGVSPTGVNAALTGLTPGTTYHFRVKAVNAGGMAYSDNLSFTTLQLPTATTEAPTSVANTTATLNGTVNATNLSTTATFEYGPTISYGSTATATPNPVIGGNATSVSAAVTGLTLGTTYHFRVKAVSTGGTTYGNDITFTTLQPPTVNTEAATFVTISNATLNGTVNANNSSTIVTFEYGLTTTYGSTSTAVESPVSGATLKSVSKGITGLTSGQTYHYSVKAVSPGGTAYGGDILFRTPVSDNDGNLYNIVTIGIQVWMKENLKTTKYNDGTYIPNVTDNATWAGLNSPAYCWYNNDVFSYKDAYGALYNWYAVNTGKLCPAGWHVPTDADFTTLTDYLTNNGYGYEDSGSDIAKSMAATSGWTTFSTAGTIGNDQASNNSSGFTAVPGGARGDFGSFGSIEIFGDNWSATESSAASAWNRSMYNNYSGVDRDAGNKKIGFSVRCLRDY